MTFVNNVEPILVGLVVALILFERSRHTFKSRREFLDVLNPTGKRLGTYLIETAPIFIYTVSVLICLFLYFYRYPDVLSGKVTRAFGILLFVCGMGLRRWAIRALGPSWTVYVAPPSHPDSLVTSAGPYKYLRHPYYLGSTAEFFGLLMFLVGLGIASVITAIQLVAYTVRARAEEQQLLSKFNTEYAMYRNRVGGFLPKLEAGRHGGGCRAMTIRK